MRWLPNLHTLPVRTKVAVTLAGAVVVLVGIATTLSFRYWEDEALRAAEQQALLAASATRSTLESSLRMGSEGTLRRHLLELLEQGPTLQARAYASDGTIVYSAHPGEEGSRRSAVWIPDPATLPRAGVTHPDPSGGTVRVFLPLAGARANLLEITSSVAPIRSAMRRGALLGLALALGSVVVLAVVLGAMLEREVVTPLSQVGRAIADRTGRTDHARDEVSEIRESLEELIAHEEERASQAAQREGFATVGQLAAEMAHEFKRPLASIRSALDILEQEYRLDDTGRGVMHSVNEQLARLSETMQDLFSLARPVEVHGSQVQVSDVLDDALVEFAGHPEAGRVRVSRRYQPGLPPILGDERRLRQGFANLMINALEAMTGGGTLFLEAAPSPEGCVRVRISDTGPGIPESEVERIFLPFYSTKPQGTGLGLPLVARVVAAHGGRLMIEGEEGKGTTVIVDLPPAPEAGANLAQPCPEKESWSSTTTT
ncbi:MAG: hypothetical protein JSU98_03970 [Gemmatimonadales bacterium]|nr:MAG: hypothetical protein JSU98_03970 [Gemmatimonadales bacterium]